MSLTAASSGFVLVLLLTLPVIQGQNDWRLTCAPTQICAVVGSTVDISCSYRDPDWRTDDDTTAVERLWFTKSTGTEPVDLRADSEHSGRVQYLCGDNDCTLTITDLRESDSAVYKLSLTTNKAGEKHTGEAGVTCLSQNGQKTGRETPSFSAYFDPSDSFSCALKGHEDFLHLQSVVETKTGRSTLRITDLTETDSAHYHFTFQRQSFEQETHLPGTTLTVTALELQVTRTITVHQSHTEAELKCLSSCSPADGLSYVWIRNGEKIMKGEVLTQTVFSWRRGRRENSEFKPEPKEAVEMMEVDSGPVYEDVTTAAQTEDREEQED
ncbi:hypothetical protein INR49_019059, partial [Caranx melampygus]